MPREREIGMFEGSEGKCKHNSRVSVLRGETLARREVLKYQADIIIVQERSEILV